MTLGFNRRRFAVEQKMIRNWVPLATGLTSVLVHSRIVGLWPFHHQMSGLFAVDALTVRCQQASGKLLIGTSGRRRDYQDRREKSL